jgi:hypothetical protein
VSCGTRESPGGCVSALTYVHDDADDVVGGCSITCCAARAMQRVCVGEHHRCAVTCRHTYLTCRPHCCAHRNLRHTSSYASHSQFCPVCLCAHPPALAKGHRPSMQCDKCQVSVCACDLSLSLSLSLCDRPHSCGYIDDAHGCHPIAYVTVEQCDAHCRACVCARSGAR